MRISRSTARRRLLRAVATTLVAVASGCSPRQGLEQLVLYDRVVRAADNSYGVGTRQRLDVYRERRARTAAPVVVFLYGGRWKYGSKRDYLLVGNALARRGLVVVIPDYRLFPEVRFPAWVEDGAQAVRWTRDNIARYGGDPRNIIVVGHSAGAHTAAMLALDEHFLSDVGLPRDAVRGFVSLAGPVDTIWTDPDVQELMGPRSSWPASYPYNFIDGDEPPLFMLQGAADDVVSAGNATRLAERIFTRGGCARSIVYPHVGHVEIVIALAFPSLDAASVARDVGAFVRDPVGATCPLRTSTRSRPAR
ncbi:MAG: alpha/beta hydrolase [Gemmatimonadaceae bacterium]